jgi:sugar/nucleoside kinase (ribokinase family)
VLFLASLRPELQRGVLEQSRARLVGADSMTVFLAERAAEVRAVAEGADVLFLNQRELAIVTGDHDWRRAARGLCGRGRLRAVVVKQGRRGVACVSSNAVVEVAASDVSPVPDPTGAGDALAGGFLGLCAREERDDAPFFEIALQEGVRCAARAIASFGVDGLLAPV